MADGRAAREGVLAKILRYCRYCGKETPHEVRGSSHGPRIMCLICRERALQEELDRD